MTKQLTDDIVQGMLSFLDNAQLKQLRDVVETTLSGYEITERKETNDSFDTNQNLLSSFLSAKRIEGCSENTLKYYRKTIEMMFATINKSISHIVTDDLRQYLTDYQKQNNSSKVTIAAVSVFLRNRLPTQNRQRHICGHCIPTSVYPC